MSRVALIPIASAFLVVGLTGCAPITAPIIPTPPVADVYAAGFTTVNQVPQATYWKNGVPTVLNGGQYGAIAFSIAISESGDVYVAGSEANLPNNIAVYWKNGTLIPLSDGNQIANVYSIALSGDDVYIAGHQYIDNPTTGALEAIAEYWKNGSPVILTNASVGVSAQAIAVEGNNFYVAGYQEENVQIAPTTYVNAPGTVLWQNGTLTKLTNGPYFAEPSSIALSGGDIYVAGSVCTTTGPACDISTFWKDGVATAISTTTGNTASGIAVSGPNIYISVNQLALDGNGDDNFAEFWSNGTLTKLSTSPLSAANGVALSGADVYVGGADKDTAVYWKNGVETILDTTGHQSSAFAIAVVTQQ